LHRALLDSLSQESATKVMELQQKIQEEVTQQLEKIQDPAAISPRLASKTKEEIGYKHSLEMLCVLVVRCDCAESSTSVFVFLGLS
jgi:hypothetical protein